MEEIEYLEEYEDLVLPALNSSAAAASSRNAIKIGRNQKVSDDGDSSSSLDQDIFNCLFDDNSDDDDNEEDYSNIYEVHGGDNENIKSVEIIRQEQSNKVNVFDEETNETTSTSKPRTFATKSGNTATISINRAQSTVVNKPKSVATVRPTVQQNQLLQPKQKQKINATQQRKTTVPTTSKAPTESNSNKSTIQLPTSSRKPLSSNTASTITALVNKNNTQPGTSLKQTSGTPLRKVVKRPATIVKPEKIITKDPVNDPLNLDDISEIGSDNYTLSDISGETYNTISDLDEDDSNDEYYSGHNDYEEYDDDNISYGSQIIELSNDSSGSHTKLEDLRAPTPSPVISDDSDTSSNSFDYKLKKLGANKPYSHAIIIESVLRKGERPKLLELLKQYNLYGDEEEETNVTIDITTSKENLSKCLEVDTVKCKTLDKVDNINQQESDFTTASLPTSSASKDKNKLKKKILKNMDRPNASMDSTDSDLSAVEELLEESYAEAMKRLNDVPLTTNQEIVGAELEIAGEEEVTAIEFVKNPEDNKQKLTKPRIVIDYEDNPLVEEESTQLKESNEMTMEQLIEILEKEEKMRKELKKTGKSREKTNALAPITQIKPKGMMENEPHTSKNVPNNPESSRSKEKESVTETLASKQVTNKPERSSLEQTEIIENKPHTSIKVIDEPKEIVIESASPIIRKKKRFRNLKTPEPDIVKSGDDMNDFIGFDDSAKPIENCKVSVVDDSKETVVEDYKASVIEDSQVSVVGESKTLIVVDSKESVIDDSKASVIEDSQAPVVEDFKETVIKNSTTTTKNVVETDVKKSNEKPIEVNSITKTEIDQPGSFKSPTSSHKCLQDKQKETKDKHSGEQTRKELKLKSSQRDNSKEKHSRESSKERSSRESSKDRSRENSKDRTKPSYVKDTDTKQHKEHRRSNDSKDSSRSRESSKSRDSKHSNDKKDQGRTSDVRNKKVNDIGKKESKDYKGLTENKDTVQNKKIQSNPTKDSQNLNKAKHESKEPQKYSPQKLGSSSSRDSSKDRKDIKKHVKSSTKSIEEGKKLDILNKSTESLSKNKHDKVVTTSGTKMESNKTSISSTKVSNSNEKFVDKTQSLKQKITDSTSAKAIVKPNIDGNTGLKVTPQKTIEPKSIDSKNKNIKANSIIKNATSWKPTQSSDIKTIKDRSNTSLNAIPQRISESMSKDFNNKQIKDPSVSKTVTPSKSTSQNPVISTAIDANKPSKTNKDNSNSDSKAVTQKTIDSKSKDSNNKNIKEHSVVKTETPSKSTSKNPVKSTPTDSTKTPLANKDKSTDVVKAVTKKNSNSMSKDVDIKNIKEPSVVKTETPSKLTSKNPVKSSSTDSTKTPTSNKDKSTDVVKAVTKKNTNSMSKDVDIKNIKEPSLVKTETPSKSTSKNPVKSTSTDSTKTPTANKDKSTDVKAVTQKISNSNLKDVNIKNIKESSAVKTETPSKSTSQNPVKSTSTDSTKTPTTNKGDSTDVKAVTKKISDTMSKDVNIKNIKEPSVVKTETPSKSTSQNPVKSTSADATTTNNGDSTEGKAVTQKISDSMSKDLNIKNIKEPSIAKTETPSKLISQNPVKSTSVDTIKAPNNNKDNSGTLLKSIKQKNSDSMSKDLNNQNIKDSAIDKTEMPSQSLEKLAMPDSNKNSNKHAQDNSNKKITSKPPAKSVDHNMKPTMANATKSINKTVDQNKKTGSVANKSLNKVEEESNKKANPSQAKKLKITITDQNESNNKQATSEEAKDTKTLPTNKLTKEASSKTVDDANKSKGSPSKVVVNKPIEIIQKEKSGNVCEKEEPREQYNKTTMKGSSEEPKNKETKIESEDKTAKSLSIKTKEELQSESDETNSKVEGIEKCKEQSVKTTTSQSDNTSGTKQEETVVSKTEKKDVTAVAKTIESIEVKQSKDLEGSILSESKTEKCSVENISETNTKPCFDKPTTETMKIETKVNTKMYGEESSSNESKLINSEIESEVAESNIELKKYKQPSVENISLEKDEIKEPKEIASITRNKTDEVVLKKREKPKDIIEKTQSNENSTKQDFSKATEIKEIIKDVSVRKRKSKVLSSSTTEESKVIKSTMNESIKPQQNDDNVPISVNNEKRNQPEMTIEPRVTRSRMETNKNNENIADSTNSSQDSDLSLNAVVVDIKVNEPEKKILETRITRQRVNNELTGLLQQQQPDGQPKLQVAERIKTDIKTDDRKSKSGGSSTNKTAIAENADKEMHDTKTKENRAEIKEAQPSSLELSQSLITEEKTTENTLNDDTSEKNTVAVRTRNRVVVKTDEKEPKKTKEFVTENNALKVEKAEKNKLEIKQKEDIIDSTGENNFEPIRLRKRADVKVGDLEQTGSIELLKVDKTKAKDHSDEEKIVIEAKSKDNLEPKLTKKLIDLKEEDEPTTILSINKGRTDVKNQTREDMNTIGAENTVNTNVEPKRTRRRVEVKLEDLKATKIVKSSGEADVFNSKGHETNDDSIEPIRTRKRAEEMSAIGVKTDDNCETISLRKRSEVTANDLKQQENVELSKKEKNEVKYQAIKEIKDTEKAVENVCEPIRTRKRADVKVDDMKQKESKEHNNEEKTDTNDQRKDDVAGPMKTRRRLEEANVIAIEKTRESTPELIITRKRANVKSDESLVKKEEANVSENEPKVADRTEKQNIQTSNEKTPAEDNLVGPIRTRKRAEEFKTDNGNVTVVADVPKKDAESELAPSYSALKGDGETEIDNKNIQHAATSNSDKQSKTQIAENPKNEAEIKISSNDNPITSDNILRRALRKRGAESPLSENDNKKIFKEPSMKQGLGSSTPKGSGKIEKPLTNITTTGLKRSLRSPVSDFESASTTKRSKLETARKTTRFRNLNDDCLEEEELPVITAGVSVVATELDDADKQLKKFEDHEKISPLPRKSIRNESQQNKNIEESVDKNVVGELEKSTEIQVKTNKILVTEKESKKTEAATSNKSAKKITAEVNKNVEDNNTALNNEKSINNENTETAKQNTTDRSKTSKTKTNTLLNKPSGVSSSVLSFSDWLKTKEKSTLVDDNAKDISVKSTSISEMSTSNPNIRGKDRVKAKSTTNVVETATTHKTDQQQESLKEVRNQLKKEDAKKEIRKESTLLNTAIDTSEHKNSSQLESTQEDMENATEQTDQINKQRQANKTRNTNKKSKTKHQLKAEDSQLLADVQQENKSSASKDFMDESKSYTPTSMAKQKSKKREIDILIESMSKEMKDGGISDLLNTETHVKRQRLSTKRSLNGSTEYLHTTTTHSTIKEPTAAAITIGSVAVNKEVPKVIEFLDTPEIATTTARKDVSKSPNKRNKLHSNTTKTNKPIGAEDTSVKLRKSIMPREQATQNKDTGETASATAVTKSRKSMPQTNLLNAEKNSASAAESTKARKSLPSSIKSVQSENSSKIFKAPKPVVHTSLLNLIPNQENIAKLYGAEDNRRSQGHNKLKSTNILKTYKCRNLKIRLNRSKVQKYLRIQKELNNEKPVQTVAEPPAESTEILSSVIQNIADSNLRIQSVVNTADLMDQTPDYNPNNIFVPDDSFIQTSVTPSTLNLEPVLPPSTITPVSASSLTTNEPYVSPQGLCDTIASLPIVNAAADPNEHIELKNEFLDENPIDLVSDALLPDTPTLLARAQSVTEAAQHALSSSTTTPTDIRLLTTETTATASVPSFGVTPTVLDNRGTCMYTFLHPAKYNRNHSNVLLDYCCPNLDGPMPAIDPTRIHAQVQVPVIELPASIVLTTKVVTRADLERQNSNIPAIIRKKAEKIRSNLAAHHKVAAASAVVSSSAQQSTAYMPNVVTATPKLTLPPTINALTKQLPSTTTITAKIRPTQHQENVVHDKPVQKQLTNTVPHIPTTTISVISKGPPQLSQVQKSTLRSNLRRFDVLLKQLVLPFDNLTFVDRHRIIEAIIATGKILPKDLDRTIVLLEEYIKQTKTLSTDTINNQTASTAAIPLPPSTTTNIGTNNYHMTSQPARTIQMPQLQPSPSILASSSSSSYCRQLEELHKKTVKQIQTTSKNTSSTSMTASSPGAGGALIKKRQVPIYDTERNIIGYQMKIVTPMAGIPAYTKSTMSTHTGTIMSTSLDTSNNKITTFGISKRPVKRPAQDSPRVFYATPPLKTSTPKAAITNPTHVYPSLATNKQNNSKTIAQKTEKGSIVTTLRTAAGTNNGSSTSSSSTETITTTTMATVKRVTRSTATGSKIIIVSKSNQSSEETILPDTNQQQPEIKNEKDSEDFIG